MSWFVLRLFNQRYCGRINFRRSMGRQPSSQRTQHSLLSKTLPEELRRPAPEASWNV